MHRKSEELPYYNGVIRKDDSFQTIVRFILDQQTCIVFITKQGTVFNVAIYLLYTMIAFAEC